MYADRNELFDPVKDLEKFQCVERRLDSDASILGEHTQITITAISEALRNRQNEVEVLREKLAKRLIVFLADFVGSGHTVLNDISRFAKHYTGKRVVFAPLIVTEDALTDLNDQAFAPDFELELVPGFVISKRYKALSAETGLVSDTDQQHKFGALCDGYFDRLREHADVKKHGWDIKHGFGHCELLFVLYWNTPNNSIPLIWANGSRWTPLFERLSSYKSHSTRG